MALKTELVGLGTEAIYALWRDWTMKESIPVVDFTRVLCTFTASVVVYMSAWCAIMLGFN